MEGVHESMKELIVQFSYFVTLGYSTVRYLYRL